MDKINCPSWEGCAAPLCPLEPLPGAQWFPNEDICHTFAYRQIHWIKMQRKIRKLYVKGDVNADYCFTLTLLEAIRVPRKGTHGISPEYLNESEDALKPFVALEPPPGYRLFSAHIP